MVTKRSTGILKDENIMFMSKSLNGYNFIGFSVTQQHDKVVMTFTFLFINFQESETII